MNSQQVQKLFSYFTLYSADVWFRINARDRHVLPFFVQKYCQPKDYTTEKRLQYRKGKEGVLLVGRSPRLFSTFKCC